MSACLPDPQDVRVRFRVIFNSAINCPIQLSIDHHLLDVLALDGRPVQALQMSESHAALITHRQ